MHIRAEHAFAAPPAPVLAILTDPAFHVALDLPDLSRPEVVEHRVEGRQVTLALRYQYTGQLDPMARRLIGAHRLTWAQTLDVDLDTGRGTLQFRADADPQRLQGDATVAVTETPAGCRRLLDGDLSVRVPVIGGKAERRIVPGLLRRLDIEAAAVAAALP